MVLDPEELVRRASQGDVNAFVDLTRRFQHSAFGSALALLQDFQQAEDVVQEAFLAAWACLPTLADPAAFPGWLRGIVRHHAFRLLRRRQLQTLPLTEAGELPNDEVSADQRIAVHEQAAAALVALAELPPLLREPAMLFYVHECSQQDVATFLGLSVTTVSNRLHAARKHLKERILTMNPDGLQARGLPDDFANRIGRLVEARHSVVEALFDQSSLPDILSELAVSDERHRRGIALQVIQRPGGGLVRAVATAPVDALPRGAAVLSSGRASETHVDQFDLAHIVPLLTGRPVHADENGKLLETGIKVIDVMCPLVAGGTVAIAGELSTGTMVVMEELVRRLSGGTDRVALFTVMPRWRDMPPGWSIADELQKKGYSEGTVGAVQTFFFRSDDGPWTAERLAALAPVDTVIHLSRDAISCKIYPGVDVLTSRSRLLEMRGVGPEHAAIVARVRDAIRVLRAGGSQPSTILDRARKLQSFFGQPFFVAEPYTKRPGSHVSRAGALSGCLEILDGQYDDLPVEAFHFGGSTSEIRQGSGQH